MDRSYRHGCLVEILILTPSELRVTRDFEQSNNMFNILLGTVAVATHGKWDVGDKNRREIHKTAIDPASHFSSILELIQSSFSPGILQASVAHEMRVLFPCIWVMGWLGMAGPSWPHKVQVVD